ncbi:MAG: hypothetical protein HFH48_05310 [Lachnospiraceae bacterium]|nr:hypothetical protein [Lachnospiraceae bacterium]
MTALKMNSAVKKNEKQEFAGNMVSLCSRFVNYLEENRSVICAGMQTLNSSADPYGSYAMKKSVR